MEKSAAKKRSEPCTSTASGGDLKCVLDVRDALGREHTVHTTSKAGRNAAQYATWSSTSDGRTRVITYARGKRQSEWYEGEASAPAPVAPAKSAKKTKEPSLTELCSKCNRELGEHDGKKCPPKSKVNPLPGKGQGMEQSAESDPATPHRPLTLDDEPDDPEADEAAIAAMDAQDRDDLGDDLGDDPYEDEVRSDDDRAFARQQREAREAHAAELEATVPPMPSVGTTSRIGDHEIHPAAALFPLIQGDEYKAFVADLRTNGQRKRIVRIRVGSSWQILDGRNRLRGCIEVGYEPKFRTFGDDPGDGTDPIAFVISENIARRHLDETQRAFVGAELVPMYEAQAKERQRAAGGDRKSDAKKSLSPNSGEAIGKATELAARAVNVGKTSIEAALKVKRDAAPEVLEAARDRGQIKVSTAAELVKLPQQKQREIVEKIGGGELRSGKVRALVNQEKKRAVVRKINEQRVAPMPTGPFGVIYGDYPWHYDNSDQHEGSRGHLGYPTMKLEDVLAHARETAKRAAKNCIVALWSTNLYITKMERVVEAFGAVQRTVFTWPKPKWGVGGWGRGQTEHLVIASIGEPVHTLNEVSTLLPSWKPAHPGEHSSKPVEVAALLAKHCGGPFLELFGREPRKNWAVWGAEANKFATTEETA